jgi:cell division septum initiation protein DivIVA
MRSPQQIIATSIIKRFNAKADRIIEQSQDHTNKTGTDEIKRDRELDRRFEDPWGDG